jgi:hypothetical protein
MREDEHELHEILVALATSGRSIGQVKEFLNVAHKAKEMVTAKEYGEAMARVKTLEANIKEKTKSWSDERYNLSEERGTACSVCRKLNTILTETLRTLEQGGHEEELARVSELRLRRNELMRQLPSTKRR